MIRKAYFFENPLSALDTLSCEVAQHREEVAQYRVKNSSLTYNAEAISSLSINALMHELGPIEFINIDIESLDRDLMLMLDFDRFFPCLTCYKNNAVLDEDDSVRDPPWAYGYRLVFALRGSIRFALQRTEQTAT